MWTMKAKLNLAGTITYRVAPVASCSPEGGKSLVTFIGLSITTSQSEGKNCKALSASLPCKNQRDPIQRFQTNIVCFLPSDRKKILTLGFTNILILIYFYICHAEGGLAV